MKKKTVAISGTSRVGLMFLWFFAQEHPKAQPAVVLVSKRLRRRGHGFTRHRFIPYTTAGVFMKCMYANGFVQPIQIILST